MPCLEISMPKVSRLQKSRLAEELTEAFHRATGFDREIFAIRFYEYEHGQTAAGGKLNPEFPYLHMLLYIPKITRKQKQAVVAELSRSFAHELGEPEWIPVIHIAEHPFDNVGVDGKLLTDMFPVLRDKEFYYSMEDEE